jgi:site-specific DNA-methyltransferase (adenine-specific)
MDFKTENVWLMQGDCIERMKEIPEGSVDFVFADIPYGMTQNKWDTVIPFKEMWEQIHRITKKNAAVCLMAATPFDKVLGVSNIKELRYEWIWQKNKSTGFLNAKKMPMRNHENILVFYRNLPVYNSQKTKGHKPVNSYVKNTSDGSNYGDTKIGISGGGSTERHPLTILPVPVINNDGSGEERMHPTQKPLALMEHFILTYTNKGDTVLDFTFGKGGTIEAARIHGRKAIGIENGHCEKQGHRYQGMEWTDVLHLELEKKGLL